MPSPFPGMDPFLKNPEIFPDLHDSFITYLREALQANLPGSYDYHISVHCFDELGTFLVYPIHLEDSLPAVAIPLLPGDPPVDGSPAIDL